MFEAYCRGVILYGPYYWEHVFNYLKGSLEDKDHILFTKYEEIIEEQSLQVKRLPEFLQLSIRQGGRRDGSVEKILSLCSLCNLSNLETNKNGTTRIGVDTNVFFRKG
ncbi:unnamed protein product, partial [Brassica oleracea var. botrytis]